MVVAIEEEEDCHGWHFRYNRRLACFSNAISACVCSQDGKWLVCGTGSGDVKVWDTCSWAEVAKLKGFRSQEPRTLTFSPAQRSLVCAYTEALYVFETGGNWRLQLALPALMNDMTKAVSKWMCVAFSQHKEVNHGLGATGHDTHLGALSATHLHVLDYSGGWKMNMPSKTRSLMQSSKPVSMTYTSCGAWLMCGFEGGQIQIWNSSSLMLEKSLTAHDDLVTGIASSPSGVLYDSRIISCSKDQTIRVWHPVVGSWLLEQHVHEPKSGRHGLRSLCFASDGMWLATVGMELCIWRVCVDESMAVHLEIHQYVEAVCGSEGLRIAAFSCGGGIAAGSWDGVLGLWMKAEGRPETAFNVSDEGASSTDRVQSPSMRKTSSWSAGQGPRPMHRLSPVGGKTIKSMEQHASGWSAAGATHQMPTMRVITRPISRSALQCLPGSPATSLAAAGRMAMNRPESSTSSHGSPLSSSQSSPALPGAVPDPTSPVSPQRSVVRHSNMKSNGSVISADGISRAPMWAKGGRAVSSITRRIAVEAVPIAAQTG